MEILINNNFKICELQHQFSSVYPFLKIEFFELTQSLKGASHKLKLYPADRKISSCRKIQTEGSISLDYNQTVKALQQEFSSKYGLIVQVHRKSGKLWIETSLTDSWTLVRQNQEGAEFSRFEPINEIKRNAED
jgi:hypothetical protein